MLATGVVGVLDKISSLLTLLRRYATSLSFTKVARERETRRVSISTAATRTLAVWDRRNGATLWAAYRQICDVGEL